MTVDREQIRRDVERLRGYDGPTTIMVHHCLALLAELEQAEKTISAQKDILDNEEMNAYAQYQLRVQAESRLAKVPALVDAVRWFTDGDGDLASLVDALAAYVEN